MSASAPDFLDLTKGPVFIGLKRRKFLFFFMFAIALSIVFVHVIFSDAWSTLSRALSLVCFVLLATFVPLIAVQIIRLYVNKLPAFALTQEGFINGIVSPTMIPWGDVASCAVENLGTQLFPVRMLVIGLKPGALDHLAMPWFMRVCYFHASVFFIGDTLEMSLCKLADVFDRYSRTP